ncbi:hypothetical protein Bca52824_086492 [Brassica carinata]|uniref:Uncharacterized protein n=1 Tax=Brassica carinata TaxID=52824 RepID=A0A8X7PBV9_BRACI|nr:hypothetical protein Bca52824_086492 [Brassica carinata]
MARGFPLCETNDDEPIADNADDGSRYFNSGLPEGEIGPNYWENANNGSTGYIRQAVEGGTQYNPIHVTVAENSDEGTKEDDDASKVNEKRQTGGVEGVHDSYIHVTDDSDNRHVATPMGSDRVIINDSSSDIASCRNSSPTNLPTATMDARTGWSYNPHTQNILTTAEVEMMICVHEWNTEPRLCVIFGAEEVATYQFRCRSPFTIGRRHFLGDGVTEEQHMAAVLGIYFLYFAWNHTAFIRTHMIRGNEFLYSQSVMAEIFNEDEMVLLYRFSLEIEKAKNSLDLNLGPTVESGDHIVPSVGRTWIVNRVDGDRARMNTANGYAPTLSTVNFAEFRPVPTGVHSRTSVPAHAYDPGCYSPPFWNLGSPSRILGKLNEFQLCSSATKYLRSSGF